MGRSGEAFQQELQFGGVGVVKTRVRGEGGVTRAVEYRCERRKQCLQRRMIRQIGVFLEQGDLGDCGGGVAAGEGLLNEEGEPTAGVVVLAAIAAVGQVGLNGADAVACGLPLNDQRTITSG